MLHVRRRRSLSVFGTPSGHPSAHHAPVGLKLVAVVDLSHHALGVGGHLGHVVGRCSTLPRLGNGRCPEVPVPHGAGNAGLIRHLAPKFGEAPLRVGQGGLGIDDCGPVRTPSSCLPSSPITIGHSRKSTVPFAAVVNCVFEAVNLSIRL